MIVIEDLAVRNMVKNRSLARAISDASWAEMRSLPVNVREWTCPECGVVHDRDINAAKNVPAGGLSVIACGDGVRPPRS